jgi:16S rRNA C967 or C1407 C5-methylase (RsmB/RsmF family)
MIRWMGLIDHFSPRPLTQEGRLEAFLKLRPIDYHNDQSIPPHIRVSFPKQFYELIVRSLGEEKAWEFCLRCNEQAPTTVRANLLKTNRDDLLARWKDHYAVAPCAASPVGILFRERANFFSLPEFKEGLFEVQDEASQLVAALVEARPGDHVLDFCSGSGGKTLAFAPFLQGKGQIYLHDVRDSALEQAKKRLYRAGIQNAQLLASGDSKKNLLKEKMDWVLVDAPCSGSGTLRRNPDMKWKFSEDDLNRLVSLQREIFQTALVFVKPQGTIVYATCSVLPQENEEQVRFFEETCGVKLQGTPFSSFPSHGGMDGFFAAVFKKRQGP